MGEGGIDPKLKLIINTCYNGVKDSEVLCVLVQYRLQQLDGRILGYRFNRASNRSTRSVIRVTFNQSLPREFNRHDLCVT